MKRTLLFLAISFFLNSLFSQQIPNGDMEQWDNPTASNAEPVGFNSNKTGSTTAQIGPQTCFRDGSDKHGGLYSARLETVNYVIAVVNGSLTTGVVNSPTTNKADGYIGTINYSNSSDVRRMAFSGRPDSIVGWYHYTQGGAQERGKVRAILHVGHYFDPETASSYHPDSSANRIADALFLTPQSNVSAWTRFSVPFTYYDNRIPAYIMINATPSNNQLTTVAGSKLWLDDLSVVYNPTAVQTQVDVSLLKVYAYKNNLYVDLVKRNSGSSVLTLFDITGQQVLKTTIENSQMNTISLSEFSSGIYFYSLSGNGFSKSGKFVID